MQKPVFPPSYFGLRLMTYVQVSPENLSLLGLFGKKEFAFAMEPWLAIDQSIPSKAKIVATGVQAKSMPTTNNLLVVNPFQHPRTLVADFLLAEQLLKQLFKQAYPRSIFMPRPTVILHPPNDPEGGYTNIELRALRDLVLGAGASQFMLWQGDPFTMEHLKTRRSPSQGELFN